MNEEVMKIELRGVTKGFSNGWALRDVSAEFPSGSFTAVIGPSGAGKSTLLRLINGMERADAGAVLIDGANLTRARGAAKRALQRKIGTIFQDFCLVEQTTALQNALNGSLGEINFAAALLGWFGAKRTARARQFLERVGLGDKAGQTAASLSGGEKQRVAIARVLMQGAKTILADEPAASLDPVHAENVLGLLKELQREGRTVIMNSHNVEQARRYANRVVGLSAGRIVFVGSPDELTGDVLRSIYGGAL